MVNKLPLVLIERCAVKALEGKENKSEIENTCVVGA